MVEINMKVMQKGLQGKAEVPTVVLGNDDGQRLIMHVDRRSLDGYEIEQEYTVKVVRQQQTLG